MSKIQFPITVTGIEFKESDPYKSRVLFGGNCGDMVSVRPCAEEYGGKTFLGVLLGELPLSQSVSLKDGVLIVEQCMYNPAIFIPERNAIVFGCGSFWGRIKSADQLRKITDDDINNVWYMKALKQLDEGAANTGVA